MNQYEAFAKASGCGTRWNAYLRTLRDGGAKPIRGIGGKPKVFDDELSAVKEAMEHLLRYINIQLVRDGEIIDVKTAVANAHFKNLSPTSRRKKKRGKNGKGSFKSQGPTS